MIFQEKQRFDQWWLWVLLLGIEGLFIYSIVQYFFFGHPIGNLGKRPGGIVAVIFINFIFLGPLILGFFFARLETRIDEIGIHYRWNVFGGEFNSIKWGNIKEVCLTVYNNMGAGSRSSTEYGTVYNTSGNKGLQIILNSGEKYMIGTHKPEELMEVLNALEANLIGFKNL